MIIDWPNRDSARAFAEQFRVHLINSLLANKRLGQGLLPEVLFRLKTETSAEQKLARKGKSNEPLNLNDFLGLRVLVCHTDQLREAAELVRGVAQYFGLVEFKFDDAFHGERSLPYRSIHVDFDLQAIKSTDERVALGMEVQITTYIGRIIAEISHALVYKDGRILYQDKDQERLMSLMSQQGRHLEITIAELFRNNRTSVDQQ